jgi:hypothetical protein
VPVSSYGVEAVGGSGCEAIGRIRHDSGLWS